MHPAIETQKLRKVYHTSGKAVARQGAGHGQSPTASAGTDTVAVEGLELTVNEGEFFGVIGPNGAGKTTTIGMLTTRVRPTGGKACVAGADVVSQSVIVRQRIGVVPQRPNPDRSLDAWENLIFHAAYFGVARKEAARRATALLERLEIAEKAHMKVDQLSDRIALIDRGRLLALDTPANLKLQTPDGSLETFFIAKSGRRWDA